MWRDIAAVLAAVGSAATLIAVVVALRQLTHAQEQATQHFEDALSREYRSILRDIPVEAFYSDGDVALDRDHLGAFYRYFDLCNEQLFQGQQGLVREKTLAQWHDGIEGNLRLPVVRTAWQATAERIPSDFLEELRRLAPPDRLGA